LLEQAVYFGWVWEPNDSVDVTVETRSNDAHVDLVLENVGGDGSGMEKARRALHFGLHIFGLHIFWWH